MKKRSPDIPAPLIIIDLQKAIDDPSWGIRNNPDAEENISILLTEWRERNWPVFHVKHNSLDPTSAYRPGQVGNDFKDPAQPRENEQVIEKMTHSAFIKTDLEQALKSAGHNVIVIAGVITNNSVEATVRHANNLGFDTYLIEDACFTFGKRDWNGHYRSAEGVHAMSLANLDPEYCQVKTTLGILGYFQDVQFK